MITDGNIIGIVGPCAAGKSTLITGLHTRGFEAKHIAQEHSFVRDMWQRITKPDLLIYLDVSYPATLTRRKTNWTFEEYMEQVRRLVHARVHADLIIDTTSLTISEVLEIAVNFISGIDEKKSEKTSE